MGQAGGKGIRARPAIALGPSPQRTAEEAAGMVEAHRPFALDRPSPSQGADIQASEEFGRGASSRTAGSVPGPRKS